MEDESDEASAIARFRKCLVNLFSRKYIKKESVDFEMNETQEERPNYPECREWSACSIRFTLITAFYSGFFRICIAGKDSASDERLGDVISDSLTPDERSSSLSLKDAGKCLIILLSGINIYAQS